MGTNTVDNARKQITGLTIGETYYAYAEVYDLVGNVTRVPSTNQISVTIQANWNNETTSKKYMTMQDAFSEASSGDTLTLLSNYTDSSSPNLTKTVIVDTNGKTISKTTNGITIASNGTLRLKGSGTITTGDNIDLIINKGNLELAYSALTSTGSIGYYNFTGTLENSYHNSGGTKAVIWNQSGGTLKNGSPLSNRCTIRGAYRSIYNMGTVDLRFVNFEYYSWTSEGTTDRYGCTLYNGSSCTLSYCRVSSVQDIAIYNSGALTITGSETISSTTDYGIYSSGGIVNLGSSGSPGSGPVVTSGVRGYGLYITGGTVNFYGGEIRGDTSPGYYGTLNIPSGYKISTRYVDGGGHSQSYYSSTVTK